MFDHFVLGIRLDVFKPIVWTSISGLLICQVRNVSVRVSRRWESSWFFCSLLHDDRITGSRFRTSIFQQDPDVWYSLSVFSWFSNSLWFFSSSWSIDYFSDFDFILTQIRLTSNFRIIFNVISDYTYLLFLRRHLRRKDKIIWSPMFLIVLFRIMSRGLLSDEEMQNIELKARRLILIVTNWLFIFPLICNHFWWYNWKDQKKSERKKCLNIWLIYHYEEIIRVTRETIYVFTCPLFIVYSHIFS